MTIQICINLNSPHMLTDRRYILFKKIFLGIYLLGGLPFDFSCRYNTCKPKLGTVAVRT